MQYVQLQGFDDRFVVTNGTIWFSQQQISVILKKNVRTINDHVKSLETQLQEDVKVFKVTATEGERTVARRKLHYNLSFVYNIAIKAREYQRIDYLIKCCKQVGISFDDVCVSPVKERAFCELVTQSLEGIVNFVEQYRIGNYRVDLFCPELKLAIEFDEKHHKKFHNKSADIIRQDAILDISNDIVFIRVEEGAEYQGLNCIIKHVLALKPNKLLKSDG